MSSLTPIDLSRLPPPAAIEELDYERILAEMRSVMLMLMPEAADVLDLESEPINKLLQVFAVREMMLRARVNDAAKSVMLATATGADLDNLAALLGAARHVVVAADPAAVPPIPAVYEDDAAFRYRTQLAIEGFSVAGPRRAYLYHALSAHADVMDVSVDSPDPGLVRIVVLSRQDDGVASALLLGAVAAACSAEAVRPLCDTVAVVPAEIVGYAIEAELAMLDGPDTATVRAAAVAAVAAYTKEVHRLGRPVRRSALMAALHQPGVERVVLIEPSTDVHITSLQASWCTSIEVTILP